MLSLSKHLLSLYFYRDKILRLRSGRQILNIRMNNEHLLIYWLDEKLPIMILFGIVGTETTRQRFSCLLSLYHYSVSFRLMKGFYE